jgi:hypothetical protein
MPMPLEEDHHVMKLNLRSLCLVGAAILGVGTLTSSAHAQNTILAEMYGRGVHAYFAGSHNDAYELLSSAIQGGLKDPRAYYFRGLAASGAGRSYEAEADWKAGAELEATTGANPMIGKSLSRIQGHSRLKLEEVRRKAKFDALALANSRSVQRYGEIQAAQPQEVTGVAPRANAPVTPPPAAPAAGADNPFADDLDMADVAPKVESNDAFGNVMDNVPPEAPVAAAGDAPAASGADPFGAPAADAAADPFGAPAADAAADPFGAPATDAAADPFGAPAAGGDAPMADDPFGN